MQLRYDSCINTVDVHQIDRLSASSIFAERQLEGGARAAEKSVDFDGSS